MFLDKVKILVSSGKGGDGIVAFRREKYVPNGGPSGGDGGKGGDVIIKATNRLNTLEQFRYKRKYVAKNGENGGSNYMTGKDAQSITLQVPVGTVIFDNKTGKILCDMQEDSQSFIVAKGGRGGRGNQHFATSTRQAPQFAKPGDEGEEKELTLELKLIADVGLIGFPNVGKSTLLSMVTNATPKIANYHFTTLSPNLGIVKYKNASEFVMADIPGLIEGASDGLGLGHEFLRHVERTRLLVHVIDVSGSEGRDPIDDFEKINKELVSYSEKLKEKEQIILLNKVDMIDNISKAEEIKTHFENLGYPVFISSALIGEGLTPLLDKIIERLSEIPYQPLFFTTEEKKIYAPKVESDYEIVIENGVYTIKGIFARRLMGSVNLDDYESKSYFDRVLKNKGIYSKLEEMGIKDGETVSIDGYEFEYYR